MSDVEDHTWRNVLMAIALGLEFTFGAIAKALAGGQPVVEVSDGVNHEPEPSQSIKTTKTKRGKKAQAGEKKEKRAPSEYNRFVSDRLKVLKEEHPEVPNTQHFRTCAEEWKTSDRNKKNQAGGSKPAPVVNAPEEDFEEEEAEGLLEGGTQEGEDEGEEVTGGVGVQETADNGAAKEKAEKKEKRKKRKHEDKETVAAAENAGPASQKGTEEEGGTAEKRTSKKGKR